MKNRIWSVVSSVMVIASFCAAFLGSVFALLIVVGDNRGPSLNYTLLALAFFALWLVLYVPGVLLVERARKIAGVVHVA